MKMIVRSNVASQEGESHKWTSGAATGPELQGCFSSQPPPSRPIVTPTTPSHHTPPTLLSLAHGSAATGPDE